MTMQLLNSDMKELTNVCRDSFLAPTTFIDWKHPDIQVKADGLAHGAVDKVNIIKNCFEFVRDEIKHSWDFKMNPVTCKASDVLKYKTAYCYAKSHLLAALLRANGIPTGLCYQRLTVDGDSAPFCLHGFNAVFLEGYGWTRVDARGNNSSINTSFSPPNESLAFDIVNAGEATLPEIWPEPLPVVVNVLENYETYQDVSDNLPDIQLFS